MWIRKLFRAIRGASGAHCIRKFYFFRFLRNIPTKGYLLKTAAFDRISLLKINANAKRESMALAEGNKGAPVGYFVSVA
jgi:hypothetical protein